MSKRFPISPALVAACISSAYLAACGFVYDDTITGPYHLVAIDDPSEMSVCFAIGRGTCIGRIPGTVVSVGWNDRYIVAKQHKQNDKSVTNYFILEMARDGENADPNESVTGPLTETDFQKKAIELSLPPFRKTIEALQ